MAPARRYRDEIELTAATEKLVCRIRISCQTHAAKHNNRANSSERAYLKHRLKTARSAAGVVKNNRENGKSARWHHWHYPSTTFGHALFAAWQPQTCQRLATLAFACINKWHVCMVACRAFSSAVPQSDQTLQPFQKGVWGAEGMHASSRPQPFHRAGRMTKWVATVGGGGGEAGLLPGRNHI